jgi:hypothetical protein
MTGSTSDPLPDGARVIACRRNWAFTCGKRQSGWDPLHKDECSFLFGSNLLVLSRRRADYHKLKFGKLYVCRCGIPICGKFSE